MNSDNNTAEKREVVLTEPLFRHTNITSLSRAINDFSLTHNVVATQVFYNAGSYDALIYYKTFTDIAIPQTFIIATEGQIKFLTDLGYSVDDNNQLSKSEASKILSEIMAGKKLERETHGRIKFTKYSLNPKLKEPVK
jgi:hypothetical protein